MDHRRSKALGLLANPAAVVQRIGVHTTRNLDPVPTSQADTDQIIKEAAALAPKLETTTQAYVHFCANDLDAENLVARFEQIGPVITHHVQRITKGSQIRLTPVIHVDGLGVGVPVGNHRTTPFKGWIDTYPL